MYLNAKPIHDCSGKQTISTYVAYWITLLGYPELMGMAIQVPGQVPAGH